MSDLQLYDLLKKMVVQRSEEKAKRYADSKLLISAVLSPIENALKNGWSGEADYRKHANHVITAWLAIRKNIQVAPSRFPAGTLFQEFSLSLHRQAMELMPEHLAFDLGVCLEDKFISGQHPFWSGFLEKAILRPCELYSDDLMAGALLPIESALHSFDDYIDTMHAAPSATLLDLGLAAVSLALLPFLLRETATKSGAQDAQSISLLAFRAFRAAFDDAIKVPEVEDETPGLLRRAREDFDKEIEAAAFNIDFRTRGTTGVFLRPLSALFPSHEAEIREVWECLWLARATEMCAKDAVFDVEADVLNRDHTPASVWAEDFGAGSPEWCRRINALYERYLSLWRASGPNGFPAGLVAEVESRIHKNRFLIESILPHKGVSKPKGFEKLKRIYMVGSGKGGVGKSTVSWLIANSLRDLGWRIGVIDADIWGPSQDILFKRKGGVSFKGDEIVPEEKDGITVVTLGQFVAQSDAILLRSVMAANLLKRMALSVRWPELDYLVIDLPPGASDIHIQLCSIFPQAEIILVTLAQPLAIADTSRAMTIYSGLNKKVRGVVLNMTDMTCANCGEGNSLGDSSFESGGNGLKGVPVLSRLPFDIRLVTEHGKAGGSERLRESVADLAKTLIS